uniref:Uncharacterized protein n=1 Tax=Magallana gigas TaxID=29159 RepID=A0A8W8KL33_MAGGI|nr:uncharacterized protein LOC105330843 isoform X1 [Crassostrea gigas]
MPLLDLKHDEDSRTCYVLLALKGILTVSAIVLIASSTKISIVKPCDLEKAIDLLGLDVTAPCTNNDIKEKSTSLRDWGIGVLVVNFILFIIISFFRLMPEKLKLALFSILACVGILFSSIMVKSYNDVMKAEAEKSDIDFGQLKSTMIESLEKNYTSDNISSSNPISNSWNKFFIKYDCCGINQVEGTTNDFDSTPWCTTSGSCQATSSQIPKTCCNGVSEDDYESAPTACHSSVTPGTYKSTCMIAIKPLSVTNIDECIIILLQVSLLTIGTLEIAEVILVLVYAIECACFKFSTKNKTCPGDQENRNKNDGNGTTNKNTSTERNESLT